MGRIDDITKKASPIAKKAAKAAPYIAARATLTTGKAALKAGAAAATVGAKAVAAHERKRNEKEQALIEDLKQRYPGCRILLSKFDPYDADIGYKPSLKEITAYELFDEYYALQYSVVGNINADMLWHRRLSVYDKSRRIIGTSKENGALKLSVSLEYAGNHIVDIKRRFGKYEFSDLRFSYAKDKSTGGMQLCCSGRVIMEVKKIKGYEVLAIVDPSNLAGLLFYSALKLAATPRPDYGGGGE